MLTAGSTAGKSRKGPLGMKIAIGTNPDLKGDNALLNIMLDLSQGGMEELIMIDPMLEPDPAAVGQNQAAYTGGPKAQLLPFPVVVGGSRSVPMPTHLTAGLAPASLALTRRGPGRER